MGLKISADRVGVIAYTLTVDGEQVEMIAPEEAVEYLHGAENLVPGLEAALEGKQKGDKFEVTVQPEDGYGEYDDDDVEEMPVSDFEDFGELTEGMELEMVDEDGDVYDAVIKKITKDKIYIDFNSPLAGKVLNYSVEVVDVREATAEELEMGYPASLIDEMMEELDDEDEEDEPHHNHRH